MKPQKTKIEYVYNNFGVCIGERVVGVPYDLGSIFDSEEYENESAYGYDHSAFAPDLGDK